MKAPHVVDATRLKKADTGKSRRFTIVIFAICAAPEKASADDSVNRRRVVAAVRFQPCE
jgi:hypothetical protein